MHCWYTSCGGCDSRSGQAETFAGSRRGHLTVYLAQRHLLHEKLTVTSPSQSQGSVREHQHIGAYVQVKRAGGFEAVLILGSGFP